MKIPLTKPVIFGTLFVIVVIGIFVYCFKHHQNKIAAANDFINACELGDPQSIADAIKTGANVNTRDEFGATPLMLVAINGRDPEAVTELVNAGADINARDFDSGNTPLLFAATDTTNPAMITALINAGADVNAKSNDGRTALIYAVMSNVNPGVITAPVKAGEDTSPTWRGGTALGLAKKYNETHAITELENDGVSK